MWLCAAGFMAVPLLRAAVLSVVSVGICLSERRIVLFPSLFPTDRQSFARNFARRSRFRAFNRCFGHRQADKCPKLCLSVRSPFAGGSYFGNTRQRRIWDSLRCRTRYRCSAMPCFSFMLSWYTDCLLYLVLTSWSSSVQSSISETFL